MSIPLT